MSTRTGLDAVKTTFFEMCRGLERKVDSHLTPLNERIGKCAVAIDGLAQASPSANFYLQMATECNDRGQWNKAKESADAGIAKTIDPNKLAALNEIKSAACIKLREFENALEAAENGIAANPTKPNLLAILCARIIHICGQLETVDLEKIVHFANMGIDSNPTNKNTLAWLCCQLADAYIQLGMYEEAGEATRKGLEANPTNQDTLASLNEKTAAVCSHFMKWKEVESAIDAGINANPTDPDIRAALLERQSAAFEGQGMWKEARKAAQAGIEANPTDQTLLAVLQARLVAACMKLELWDEARLAAEGALELNPEDERMIESLSKALEMLPKKGPADPRKHGRTEESLPQAKRAKLSPSS